MKQQTLAMMTGFEQYTKQHGVACFWKRWSRWCCGPHSSFCSSGAIIITHRLPQGLRRCQLT